MDVFVYALIKKASQSRALEERVRVAADQLKIQESYFQELTAEVQKYRKLRHDQINYLNAQLGLINMGEADKAKELLHERIGSYHSDNCVFNVRGGKFRPS
jgi:sensor histidine kinase regulating citrate/malate metabolism